MAAKTKWPSTKTANIYWKVVHIYQELLNFEIEVKYIFVTNSYSIQDNEKVPLNSTHLVEKDCNLCKH